MTGIVRCLTVFVAVLGLAVLAAGCGGGGASGATAAGTDGTQGAGRAQGPDPVVSGELANEIQAARFLTGRDTDEVSSTGARPIKPCTLVTKKQASEILGGNVKIAERPQGPTCIFTGSGRTISMTVMDAPLKPLVEGAKSSRSLQVGGKRAYCIRYETTSVVTNVGQGRTLQVTGPCAAGVRFTAAALPRIP